MWGAVPFCQWDKISELLSCKSLFSREDTHVLEEMVGMLHNDSSSFHFNDKKNLPWILTVESPVSLERTHETVEVLLKPGSFLLKLVYNQPPVLIKITK